MTKAEIVAMINSVTQEKTKKLEQYAKFIDAAKSPIERATADLLAGALADVEHCLGALNCAMDYIVDEKDPV